jgi:hypothetical protein
MTRPTFLLALMIALGLGIVASVALYAGDVHAADAGPVVVTPAPAAPSTPPAVAAPDPAADPVGWAKGIYDAVRGGRWAMVAGLLLVGVVYATRRWLLKEWAWAQSDVGGLVMVPALALLGMAANAAMAGTWPDGAAVKAALDATVTAIAAYVAARKVAASLPARAPAHG